MEFLSLDVIQDIASQYGYLSVFLGILLENLGLPLPGETITIVGGFLAGSGELNYWLVLLSAASGAAAGGTIGYFIGRYGGWNLMVNLGKIFRVQEHQLNDIKVKFSENAVKAVFFGRFVALLRVFASPLAGIAEMPFGQFMVINIAGATAWATVMTTIAFFIGRAVSLERLLGWVSQFAIVALLIVAAWIGIPLWLESRNTKEE